MKKNFLKESLHLNKKVVKIILLCGVLISTLSYVSIRIKSVDAGLQAVRSMYDFNSIEDLNNNMSDLKKVTNSAIYKQLTIDNTDRALNTYLKFKKVPCHVEVIKKTDKYILYTLHTDALSSGRKFIFTYDTDFLGRINYVREAEVIDFYR